MGKHRMNEKGDRLSNLPDDLIHKILSFVSIKQAVETSAFSSRWRYIWTSLPILNFLSEEFHTLAEFSAFVTHVLSRRNNQIEVFAVKITIRETLVSQAIIKLILKYAFSHNLQQLHITLFAEKRTEFPLPVFISPSLQDLTLIGDFYDGFLTTNPNTWELPALTALYLYRVILPSEECDGRSFRHVVLHSNQGAGLFSNCDNLKNLTIKRCALTGLDAFNIRHPGLSKLTLELSSFTRVYVDTPQLKNLTVIDWRKINLLSAPNLSSLRCKDSYIRMESRGDLPHLEEVDIFLSVDKTHAHKILRLLQHISSVKSLTLNFEIIKCISSSVKLISRQPSPFHNLKNLKIYPDIHYPVYSEYGVTQPEEVSMSPEVKNYLLGCSPGATLTIVLYEEIKAVNDVAAARKYMKELQVVLDRLETNSMTDTTDEAPALIVSKLQTIEGIMEKLPTSHRDKLQAQYTRLRAEAETIINLLHH